MAIEDEAMKKLEEDEHFQKALAQFKEADNKSTEYSQSMAEQIVKMLDLGNQKLTIEQARLNHLTAKLAAAKLLATLSSFNYDETDFNRMIHKANDVVVNELMPMLLDRQPCGECDECKNGHPEKCLNPIIRNELVESRFLPLLAESMIRYDAWSEILYRNIPSELKDEDVLDDINDKFHNAVNGSNKKRPGRPKKKKQEDK